MVEIQSMSTRSFGEVDGGIEYLGIVVRLDAYPGTRPPAGDDEAFRFQQAICPGDGSRSESQVSGQLPHRRKPLISLQAPQKDQIGQLRPDLLECRHRIGVIDRDHASTAPAASNTAGSNTRTDSSEDRTAAMTTARDAATRAAPTMISTRPIAKLG